MLEGLPKIKTYNKDQFFLLAGPCAIEDEQTPMIIAEYIKDLCHRLEIPYVFKGSFRKANRSRLDSFTGIGDIKALEVLQRIGDTFSLPTVTDIHESKDAALVAPYVDMLQIPAFLSRQTELLVAAAQTGKYVNIKKGQFMGPDAMHYAAQKCIDAGNSNILLTERGNSFGYGDMVVDFRNIAKMKAFDIPVIMDITHSLQQPNQASGVTGGQPELIETIAKAAIAVGVDGIFIETHPEPSQAQSDASNMLKLDLLEPLLTKLCQLKEAVNKIDKTA